MDSTFANSNIFALYNNLFFISERPPQRRHMFINFKPPKVEKYVAILFFILRGICSHTFFIFHSCMHELLAYQLHSCLAIHFRFSLFKYCDMICLKGIPKINCSANFDLEQILLSAHTTESRPLPILNFKIL